MISIVRVRRAPLLQRAREETRVVPSLKAEESYLAMSVPFGDSQKVKVFMLLILEFINN